jgi:hypothetical protein
MEISIVQNSQTWWECRANVILIAIDEGSYERHLLTLTCEQTDAGSSSESRLHLVSSEQHREKEPLSAG